MLLWGRWRTPPPLVPLPSRPLITPLLHHVRTVGGFLCPACRVGIDGCQGRGCPCLCRAELAQHEVVAYDIRGDVILDRLANRPPD